MFDQTIAGRLFAIPRSRFEARWLVTLDSPTVEEAYHEEPAPQVTDCVLNPATY